MFKESLVFSLMRSILIISVLRVYQIRHTTAPCIIAIDFHEVKSLLSTAT